jgi:hypothetical protein
MKQLILVTLLSLFLRPVFSQDQNKYEDFKTGKFTYQGKSGVVEIIRTNKKQVEIFNDGKSKLILKINWINDSTYILTLIKKINIHGCLERGDWIKATITNRNGNKYECTYISKNCGGGKSVFVKLE